MLTLETPVPACPSWSSTKFCPGALMEEILRGTGVESTSAWPPLAGSLYPRNATPSFGAFSL